MKEKVGLNKIGLLHRFAALGKDYRSIVHYRSIDKVAEVIRDFGFVVSGVRGVNNGTWRSENPRPPIQLPGEPKPFTWGHAIVFVGYGIDDKGKYIEIVNSWGTDVGKEGTQKLREDYFEGGWVKNLYFDTDKENIHEHENTYVLVKNWLKDNWKRIRDEYHADPANKGNGVHVGSSVHPVVWKKMQEALNLPEWTQGMQYDYHMFKKQLNN